MENWRGIRDTIGVAMKEKKFFITEIVKVKLENGAIAKFRNDQVVCVSENPAKQTATIQLANGEVLNAHIVHLPPKSYSDDFIYESRPNFCPSCECDPCDCEDYCG